MFDQKNLQNIQRLDTAAKEIILHCNQAALYEFNVSENKWKSTETMGPLFVYRRENYPLYAIIIANRQSLTDYVEPIVDNLQLKYDPPYILVHPQEGPIRGIWLFGEDDCKRIFDKLSELQRAGRTPAPANTTSSLTSLTEQIKTTMAEKMVQQKQQQNGQHQVQQQEREQYNKKMNKLIEPKMPMGVPIHRVFHSKTAATADLPQQPQQQKPQQSTTGTPSLVTRLLNMSTASAAGGTPSSSSQLMAAARQPSIFGAQTSAPPKGEQQPVVKAPQSRTAPTASTQIFNRSNYGQKTAPITTVVNSANKKKTPSPPLMALAGVSPVQVAASPKTILMTGQQQKKAPPQQPIVIGGGASEENNIFAKRTTPVAQFPMADWHNGKKSTMAPPPPPQQIKTAPAAPQKIGTQKLEPQKNGGGRHGDEEDMVRNNTKQSLSLAASSTETAQQEQQVKIMKSIVLNLAKRIDPFANELITCYQHAVLYEFSIDQNKWRKTDTEGSLIIFKRLDYPYHSLMLIDRKMNSDFVQPLIEDLKIQKRSPYVFLSGRPDNTIYGIWTPSADECAAIYDTLTSLMMGFTRREVIHVNDDEEASFCEEFCERPL